jgi:hypothetical protein
MAIKMSTVVFCFVMCSLADGYQHSIVDKNLQDNTSTQNTAVNIFALFHNEVPRISVTSDTEYRTFVYQGK